MAFPAVAVQLYDVYLDLPDACLQSLGIGVRIREVGGKLLLTLKGPGELIDGGGLRRSEVEEEWSVPALSAIIGCLSDFGVVVQRPDSMAMDGDPLEVLSSLGFEVEHSRTTARRLLKVQAHRDPSPLLAELAIDTVVYHFAAGDITHHEVEIEIKGAGDVGVMQRVASALMNLWPESLRVWNYGKRSTGLVIESLLEEISFSSFVTANGTLLPGAYDIIAAHIE